MQTLFQRTVSAGIYFPLEDIFFQYLLDQREYRHNFQVHDRWIALVAGNLAGMVSGLILNPLASVKVRYRDSMPICKSHIHILTYPLLLVWFGCLYMHVFASSTTAGDYKAQKDRTSFEHAKLCFDTGG